MFNFMKKIPGGLLLIPMLISALFYTFLPGIFEIGGVTQALFTNEGLYYVIGVTCFCSGTTLNLSHIGGILKKEGSLLLLKIILNVALGFAFIAFFGLDGIWGISAIAYIAAICSTNPSLFLALESDYGTEDDVSAFGLVSLLCVPAYPLFVFSISQATPIDWMPIISTLIPVVLGVLLGNLDRNMAKFFAPGAALMMPFMGWAFGANINLISAITVGPQGIILTILFYIPMVIIMFLFERYIIKADGVSTLAMSTIAGMSVSVPSIIAVSNPALAEFVGPATAQIAFGVVFTSIVTPIIAQRIFKHDHPGKVNMQEVISESQNPENLN